MEIHFYQFPEDWGEETLNAALERGAQGSTAELPQLHSRAGEASPGLPSCSAQPGEDTALQHLLVWFDFKNRAQTGVAEEKLLLLLSALSERVNSYWNPAEEGCQPGRARSDFQLM